MCLASPDPSARWVSAGVLFIGSLGLFAWCVAVNHPRPLTLAYANDMPVHLNQNGPYRWIRHPFYTSYLLAYVGGLVAAVSLPPLVVVVGMSALYANAAGREERKFQSSALRHQYGTYKRRTGMFTPRLTLTRRTIGNGPR